MPAGEGGLADRPLTVDFTGSFSTCAAKASGKDRPPPRPTLRGLRVTPLLGQLARADWSYQTWATATWTNSWRKWEGWPPPTGGWTIPTQEQGGQLTRQAGINVGPRRHREEFRGSGSILLSFPHPSEFSVLSGWFLKGAAFPSAFPPTYGFSHHAHATNQSPPTKWGPGIGPFSPPGTAAGADWCGPEPSQPSPLLPRAAEASRGAARPAGGGGGACAVSRPPSHGVAEQCGWGRRGSAAWRVPLPSRRGAVRPPPCPAGTRRRPATAARSWRWGSRPGRAAATPEAARLTGKMKTAETSVPAPTSATPTSSSPPATPSSTGEGRRRRASSRRPLARKGLRGGGGRTSRCRWGRPRLVPGVGWGLPSPPAHGKPAPAGGRRWARERVGPAASLPRALQHGCYLRCLKLGSSWWPGELGASRWKMGTGGLRVYLFRRWAVWFVYSNRLGACTGRENWYLFKESAVMLCFWGTAILNC